MHTTTTDRPLEAHRTDACGCRDLEHDALCPLNPSPEVCDACAQVYDPERLAGEPDCPGGHCADEACLCWPCARAVRVV